MPTTARLAAVLCAAAALATAAPTLGQEPGADSGSTAAASSPGPAAAIDVAPPPTTTDPAAGPSPECREERTGARAASGGGRAALGALKGVGVVLYACMVGYPFTTILCLGVAVAAPWAAVGIVGGAMLIGAASAAGPRHLAEVSRERCGGASQGAPPRGGPAADPSGPEAPSPDVPLAGASLDGPVPDAQWAS